MGASIYHRPRDYDLEHEADHADVRFFEALMGRLGPRRVLELGCGSGRVALLLGAAGARQGFNVVGLDLLDAMLQEAEDKRASAPPDVQRRLSFTRGDMRTWRADEPFDLIVSPGSSISHLLTLDDQIAVWRQTWRNLVPGGRFVVDVATPDWAACAESLQSPPRTILTTDMDSSNPDSQERLIRYKATQYAPPEQRADIRFVYDKFLPHGRVERYVSDFAAHVYFPRELQLLFIHSGFLVEAIFGDYAFGPPRATSRTMIMVGRKPLAPRPVHRVEE